MYATIYSVIDKVRSSKKRRVFTALIVVVLFVGVAGFIFRGAIIQQFFRPTDTNFDIGMKLSDVDPEAEDIVVVAEGLQIPWEIAFLPDGDLLVTERPGTLKRIGNNQQSFTVEGVEHIGEGGLLGLALHPAFEENNFVYLYLTTQVPDGLINRIERYTIQDNNLSDRTVIFADIPGARFHDGGRIAFGPDGFLYVTTGDATEADQAQDRGSLAGKTLRLNDDGTVPADNPFGTAVYSYGHRNAQGIAWDSDDRQWQTEHGRSGRLSGLDEINLVQAGQNYGWPVIEGDESQSGMQNPVIHSGPDETWAPAGMAYYDGSLFFAGLRGESLYEAVIEGDSIANIKVHLRSDYGRFRAVVLGPDDHLYVSTSNTDGRGEQRSGDDKIIRINPRIFR